MTRRLVYCLLIFCFVRFSFLHTESLAFINPPLVLPCSLVKFHNYPTVRKARTIVSAIMELCELDKKYGNNNDAKLIENIKKINNELKTKRDFGLSGKRLQAYQRLLHHTKNDQWNFLSHVEEQQKIDEFFRALFELQTQQALDNFLSDKRETIVEVSNLLAIKYNIDHEALSQILLHARTGHLKDELFREQSKHYLDITPDTVINIRDQFIDERKKWIFDRFLKRFRDFSVPSKNLLKE